MQTTIDVKTMPIEITADGKNLHLALTAEERVLSDRIRLVFTEEGRLWVRWLRESLVANWLSDSLSDSQRMQVLSAPPQRWCNFVGYSTDNIILLHDFHIAAAYWGPRDGIIRLTREAITEAYSKMAEYGLECRRPSAYAGQTSAALARSVAATNASQPA